MSGWEKKLYHLERVCLCSFPGPYIPDFPRKAKWKEPTLNYNTAKALLDSKQDLLLLEFASLSQEAWSCAKLCQGITFEHCCKIIAVQLATVDIYWQPKWIFFKSSWETGPLSPNNGIGKGKVRCAAWQFESDDLTTDFHQEQTNLVQVLRYACYTSYLSFLVQHPFI